MNKTTKNLLRDLVWLCFACCITMVVFIVYLKWDGNSDTIVIHYHDTYYVIAAEHAFLLLILVICFVLFFVLEALKKFRRPVPNILLLLTGLVLVVIFAVASTWLGPMNSRTLYPPLSGLEDGYSQESDMALPYISKILLSLQITWILFLLVIVFMWGRHVGSRRMFNRKER